LVQGWTAYPQYRNNSEDNVFLLDMSLHGSQFATTANVARLVEDARQRLAGVAGVEIIQGATLPEETRKGRRKKKKGNPQFDLRQELFRMTGTDLTQIDGIDVMAAMTMVSEVGWDMSKWKSENHFVSWQKLSPDNKISGGKIIGKGRMPTNNRATTVLRMAATTLRESDSYLGAQFRRFRTRLGPPMATKPTAAKLARLIYRMLRYGMKYVNQGAKFYEAQYRKHQVVYLKRKAAQLGLQIIELPAAA
jgi:transposase